MSDGKVIPVRVALRVRPLIPKEKLEGCQACLQYIPGEPQIIVGSDKAFTYDFVFSPESPQEDVYLSSAAHLVKGIFKGYNATILAYGQTGSGKTFTMGTGYIENSKDEILVGVVPRVVKALFKGIEEKSDYSFTVKVSFLEIHQEDLNDLLAEKQREPLTIREDLGGGIRISGLSELLVKNYNETMALLERGSTGRTTGSTAMNATSSRSHAIFTIHVERTNKLDSNDCCKAKFHLVDLAGSERAKRTQAEGERFKEGVSINKGLLALGNVISALGETDKDRGRHIPYRDSKLTRLLQDSLGGNSHTIMIACVSPADSNMEETINTLRYADRARKIKNKPVVNRDPQAAEIMRLKQLVQQLQMQVMGGEIRLNTSDLDTSCTDMKSLVQKNKKLETENHKLSRELRDSVDQNAEMCEKLIKSEVMREQFRSKLDGLKQKTGLNMTMLLGAGEEEDTDEKAKQQMEFVKDLHDKILELENDNKENNRSVCSSNLTENRDSPNNSLLEEYTTEHALSQARLGKEIQEMNKIIEKKQELVAQMSLSDGQMAALKQEHEKEMQSLEKEIKSLQKEKDDLIGQLNTNRANSATSKVSEQRRKRLQELEAKISSLNKKLTEQGKMLKLKEQSDKQVAKLNEDIREMKMQRVKLVKQMKEDSQNYQKWKQQKDKEVMQLKAKDRKRQCEVVKMERKYARQQTVLRRKAEEAAAANKRLKDALQKQRDAAQDRQKQLENRDMTGVGNRIRRYLNQELEVQVSIEEGKHHMNCMMSDRKDLAEQVTKLRQELEDGEPPSKMKLLNDSHPEDASAERQTKMQQLKSLEQEIDLRNAQIADFQQKMVDADNDDKSKSRWNQIHSLVEGKVGLNALFKMCVASKLDVVIRKNELKELKTVNEELIKNMDELEERMREQRGQHEEELLVLQKTHQDRTMFLLTQLKSSKSADFNSSLNDNMKERLQFQEEEIERLSNLHDKLRKKESECDSLRKEVTVMKYQGKKSSLMPVITSPNGSPIAAPRKIKKQKPKRAVEEEEEEDDLESSIEENGEDRESVKDPDWHSGYTPGFEKWGASHSKTVRKRSNTAEDSQSSEVEQKEKPSSSCRCYKGVCKNCLCTRRNLSCNEQCKCKAELCCNRDTEQNDNDDESSPGSTLNQTFDLGRSDAGGTPVIKPDHSTVPSKGRVLLQNNHNDSAEEFKGPEKKSKPQRKRATLSVSASSADEPSENRNTDSILEGGVKKRQRKLMALNSNTFFSQPTA